MAELDSFPHPTGGEVVLNFVYYFPGAPGWPKNTILRASAVFSSSFFFLFNIQTRTKIYRAEQKTELHTYNVFTGETKDLGFFTPSVCAMGYHATYGWMAITYTSTRGATNDFVRFNLDLSDGTYTETGKWTIDYPFEFAIN